MGAQWKVKHKELAANAKGRIFTKLTKEIMVAARNGADPDVNPRLRLAVEAAKKANKPKAEVDQLTKQAQAAIEAASKGD